jgi:hypothetical protein
MKLMFIKINNCIYSKCFNILLFLKCISQRNYYSVACICVKFHFASNIVVVFTTTRNLKLSFIIMAKKDSDVGYLDTASLVYAAI